MELDLKKIEEKYSKKKPTFSLFELLKCIALIFIGCIMFAGMPDRMKISAWILFAVGSFLIVVGVFRLVSMVPEIKNEQQKKLMTFISIIAAVFIQLIGLLYLYNSGGTEKSLVLATLTLCISLGLIFYVTDSWNKEKKKIIQIACRIITVILAASAIFLIVRDDFSTGSVYVGTVLIIEAVVIGKGFFSKN